MGKARTPDAARSPQRSLRTLPAGDKGGACHPSPNSIKLDGVARRVDAIRSGDGPLGENANKADLRRHAWRPVASTDLDGLDREPAGDGDHGQERLERGDGLEAG